LIYFAVTAAATQAFRHAWRPASVKRGDAASPVFVQCGEIAQPA
jgi:hypothetical protein